MNNYAKELVVQLLVIHYNEVVLQNNIQNERNIAQLHEIQLKKNDILRKLDLILDGFDIFEKNCIVYEKQGMILSILNKVEHTKEFTKMREVLREVDKMKEASNETETK